MKYLIKFFVIIGLVSMSHVAVAIDNVSNGDLLTADGVNEVIDATNLNTSERLLDFDIVNPCGADPVYKIGDVGPSGGRVFFVTTDGCEGLEAWTDDELAPAVWGCDGTVTGAVGTVLGTGAPNTLVITTDACSAVGDAADLSRATRDTKDDWYLPSRGELSQMYNTIGPGGNNMLGGFDPNGEYWSSSERNANNAYFVFFSTGDAAISSKVLNKSVRAVRTFKQ